MMKKGFATQQEEFWAGEFGAQYIGRNASPELLAANLSFFSHALRRAGTISSCFEFGANIGMNLRALRLLYPQIVMRAAEINQEAAAVLREEIGDENVFLGSVLDCDVSRQVDLALIKGVLIHIAPDALPAVYAKLYQSTTRFILLGEYYNPVPVAIPYRGHADRLFKRDFAGEMLATYSDLRLVDYGFVYRGDQAFPQDDITWFLLEKSR